MPKLFIVRLVALEDLLPHDWLLGLYAGSRACECSDGLSDTEVTTLARLQYHRSVLCLCLDENTFVAGFKMGYQMKKEGEI